MESGKLYIVPTPIGNLGDITFRAIETLKSVDVILAEDTRQTKKILQHYEISNSLRAYHQHNEHGVVSQIITELKQGKKIALCSDAGTPGISDPGFLLIRTAIEEGISVETLPGAVAAIVAIVNSGLPCNSFVFEGFLPHKKGKQTKILSLLTETRPTIFYESPHRITKTVAMIVELLGGERQIIIARELTKKFEEYIRGTAQEVLENLQQNERKGEMVLIINGI